MRVPLLDLTRQHRQVGHLVAARIDAVLASQQFILGPVVADFEAAFAHEIHAAHAVGMSSGTDAQIAILMAAGIGPGDAVITTPYTFFATAGGLHRLGIEPVFLDIEPHNLQLDPNQLADYLATRARGGSPLRSARGNRLRAVIPVHLFGVCCDFDAIRTLAAAHDLAVFEDAAQAVGAELPGPTRHAGTLGDAAWFSFFPTKNLGGAGDGGMAVTNDAAFADKLRVIRNHGMERQYVHREVGGNFRLDAIQAATLHAKLPFLAEWNAQRRTNAAIYRSEFHRLGLDTVLTLPREPYAGQTPSHHTYHQYVIRTPRRDELCAHLSSQGIGHAVYYPIPLHRQHCFAAQDTPNLPEAERAARESLALPIFPELTPEEILTVAESLAAFHATSSS